MDTRTSTGRFATRSEIRPSCGIRFSRDVELRHDLDSGHDERRGSGGEIRHATQHTVDAQTHDEQTFKWLDVDVRRVLADRFGEDRVDHADDRGVVRALEQIRRLAELVRELVEIELVTEARDRGLAAVSVRFLERRLQQAVELRVRHFTKLCFCRSGATGFEDRAHARVRAAHDAREPVGHVLDEHAVAFRESERQVHSSRPSYSGRIGPSR